MSAAVRASWVVTGLAGVTAALGLLVPTAYPATAGTDAMLQGYDLVTVAVIVPGLAAALLARRRPDALVPAGLAEASLLAYLVYTYLYFVLGTGFTGLMLLHVAVLSTALVALVLAVARLDPAVVAAAFGPRTHPRPAAGILAALCLALAGMWIFWSIHGAVTGEVPPGSALVESDQVVHLGVVLDLTLLVPLYGAAAVLLWRRAPWGYVLGTVALVAGLLHQVSYVAALLAQELAGVPGAVPVDPVEPVILALYLAGALALLLGLRDRTAGPRAAAPGPAGGRARPGQPVGADHRGGR